MKRLVSIIVGVVVVIGAIRLYSLYRDSSPTPAQAVDKYILRITRNSPQEIESLKVVSATPSKQAGSEQVLLFQANDLGNQNHIAGYATIKQSLFGWYVDHFQMVGKSPLPDDVMLGFDRADNLPIVYGQVLLADVASVEAVFSDPNQGEITTSADIAQGNFALFGTSYSELTALNLLDSSGVVLKELSSDELKNR